VVSHDRYFLDRICDQVLAFEENGLFVQPGNYSYYLEKKKERDAARAAPPRPPGSNGRRGEAALPAAASNVSSQPSTNTANRPRKLSFKEQRELEGMEAAIVAAETRVQELEMTLNDPQFHATRSTEAHGLIAELETVRSEVTRLYERWEELSSRPQMK
jgi:ATP-binding cassette subfamily F protein uup